MNFLIANKLWLIVIGGLIGVMLGLGAEIYSLKGGIKDAKAELKEAQNELALKEASNAVVVSNLETCNAKIELANTSLKALSVPKQDESKIKERVITRVERVAVPIKDAACKEKLNFYERLLNEAGNK